MEIGIMKTDGGPHPASYWATVTAGQIIQIGAEASGQAAAAARKLELQIIDALEAAHGNVQKHERSKLVEVGNKRVMEELDASEHVEAPFNAIMAIAATSPWADHFSTPEVQDHIKAVLGNHFRSSMHVEHGWHVDGTVIDENDKPHPRPGHDPEDEHFKAFRAKYHSGGGVAS
jgi:hypothetical protein